MPYNRVTLRKAEKAFQLRIDETKDLFSTVTTVKISDLLSTILEGNVPLALAINTEKARSEMILAPILVEFRKLADPPISLFSGVAFNVDKEKGLTGTCDFIISRSTEQYFITAPVIVIVEAKNDNIKNGLGQCVAEMFAAKLFNEREENGVTTIYGAVTTGDHWKFLKLEDQTVYIDLKEYYLVNVGKILGILLHMIH
ncbi:MAG: hypothetical protein O7E52_10980 [Candidatus Poribacteria bacterium]|nr:hypothetical protein [Candidatus Poribacteria bacterium]